VSLPVLTVGAVSLNAQKRIVVDFYGRDSAKTVQEIKKSLLFGEWTEGEFDGRKLLFALAVFPSAGESVVDLHGWIYNELHREWRRFLKVNTRNIGNAKLLLDTRNGVVSVRGGAYNEFNEVDFLRFDLRATSNDAGYKK